MFCPLLQGCKTCDAASYKGQVNAIPSASIDCTTTVVLLPAVPTYVCCLRVGLDANLDATVTVTSVISHSDCAAFLSGHAMRRESRLGTLFRYRRR